MMVTFTLIVKILFCHCTICDCHTKHVILILLFLLWTGAYCIKLTGAKTRVKSEISSKHNFTIDLTKDKKQKTIFFFLNNQSFSPVKVLCNRPQDYYFVWGKGFGIIPWVCNINLWFFFPSLNLSVIQQSILAGDFVLSISSQALARIGDPDVVIVLSKVIEDLVRGKFICATHSSPGLKPMCSFGR